MILGEFDKQILDKKEKDY